MSKAIIAMDKSKSFRVYITITTDMIEEVRKIHMTSPLASAGLGRVLTAGGLMGLMLKEHKHKLTLHFKGEGPARQIMATANGKGDVKGYIANPNVSLPLTKSGKLDVGGSLGLGDLTVIKDIGLKEPYMGTIALASGEIAEDLTAYFFISEQQNTSVALGVKVERDYTIGAAGGMIIQLLPDAEEESVTLLEKIINEMKPLTTLIEENNKNTVGKTEEGILKKLLSHIFNNMPAEYAVEPLEIREINWNCDCSEERLEKVLISIGEKDLEEIIQEDGHAEMQCQFCLKKYFFDKSHLESLLEAIKQ